VNTFNRQPTLTGSSISLRPLQAADFDALYKAASDPKIWQQHPDSSRYQRDVFEQRYFSSAIASGGALAVIDSNTGGIIGGSRYYEWDAGKREIAVGYTFLECKYWGTGANQQMKALMLAHAFTHARAVWFHVGETNLRSRRAVEKLGAVLSHQQQRQLDGKAFVQLYYKLYATVE
jgi:RimJ/RimL family protein N-acetyltransferase